MLEAMSKILVFTMEEKQILGLVVKQTVIHQKVKTSGFTDSFFSYLMGDEDEEDEE